MDKTKQINIKDIPEDVLKEAKKKAIDEGKSLSEIMRELMTTWATGEKTPSPTK
jgi:plasmid stability protein